MNVTKRLTRTGLARATLGALVLALACSACDALPPALSCEIDRPTCEDAAAAAAGSLDLDPRDVRIRVALSEASRCSGSVRSEVLADVHVTLASQLAEIVLTVERLSTGKLQVCTF